MSYNASYQMLDNINVILCYCFIFLCYNINMFADKFLMCTKWINYNFLFLFINNFCTIRAIRLNSSTGYLNFFLKFYISYIFFSIFSSLSLISKHVLSVSSKCYIIFFYHIISFFMTPSPSKPQLCSGAPFLFLVNSWLGVQKAENI